jgi:hypothetical protein
MQLANQSIVSKGGLVKAKLSAFLAFMLSAHSCNPFPAFAEMELLNPWVKIEKNGRTYEIKTDEQTHQLQVSTAIREGTPPNELWIRIRKRDGIWDRLKVRLNQTTPEKYIYTGIIPSRIEVSGALRFEVEFTKKQRGSIQ